MRKCIGDRTCLPDEQITKIVLPIVESISEAKDNGVGERRKDCLENSHNPNHNPDREEQDCRIKMHEEISTRQMPRT